MLVKQREYPAFKGLNVVSTMIRLKPWVNKNREVESNQRFAVEEVRKKSRAHFDFFAFVVKILFLLFSLIEVPVEYVNRNP
jgi:hypothetical protein